MKILIPLLIAALLFTHCCYVDLEPTPYLKDDRETEQYHEDLEIDPDLWDRHNFPEGGERREE